MTARPEVSRQPRPAPGPPRPYHFPRFEERALPNGMRLIVAPAPKLPIGTMLLLADAGAVSDPIEHAGLAQLTAQLLMEGSASLGGAELAERLEGLGASASASVDWDIAVVRCTALAGQLPRALEILGEVLQVPAFPEREVERLRGERLSDLLQLRADPGALADETLARVLYPEPARYGLPAGGDVRTVRAITRDDVRAFYSARYRPAAMTAIVAGAFSPDQAEGMVRRAFGAWAGEAPATRPRVDTGFSGRAVHLVPKPDAPQSELRLGHVGVARSHGDYFPLVVMNAILGGLFSSRINLNLRERHGYTYGAHSGFDWRRDAGPFSVDTAVKTEVTAPAIREVLVEIERLRAEPVTAEELSLATSYLDGVFPIRYETTDAIAGAIANLVIHGLGNDWLDRYRERVRAVTVADVHRVARMHLHPDALQVVVVGDAAAVREPVESLGIGPVRLVDPDQVTSPGEDA